jgi:hypothetical protein
MWLRKAGFFLGCLLLVITGAACSAPLPHTKPTLLVYGDSLTVLSEQSMHFLYDGKYNIVFRAAGGTSICDWVNHAALDRRLFRPARIVIAFTGNAASCSAHDLEQGGVSAWLANYQGSLLAMRNTFQGLPISVIASPAMSKQPVGSWYPENGNPMLNHMYASMCAKYGMRYESGADDTLSPKHRFAWNRPAFPGSGPMVAVRATDGVHLSPAGALFYAAALGS